MVLCCWVSFGLGLICRAGGGDYAVFGKLAAMRGTSRCALEPVSLSLGARLPSDVCTASVHVFRKKMQPLWLGCKNVTRRGVEVQRSFHTRDE